MMDAPLAGNPLTRTWKMLFGAPLHVGERGVGLEETMAYIPSDTLFGALVVTWQEMAAEQKIVSTITASFADKVPLLLTSAFPFAGDVYLLPKPLLPLRPNTVAEDDSGKKFKKVRWVSAAIFQQLIRGIEQTDLDDLWQTGKLLQEKTIWVTKTEAKQIRQHVEPDEDDEIHLWSPQRVPKVTVDRIRNASTLFHVGRLHFAKACGLWCMAQGETAWLERTGAALRLLADSGIGGQRSRGNGQFRLETANNPPLAVSNDAKGDHVVLLSRLAPTQTQMALLKAPHAHYTLVTVGGFNGTPHDRPLVRQHVRLLSEGSIIGASQDVPGKLVNVNPYWDDTKAAIVPEANLSGNPNLPIIAHAIHRYGFGFTLPVQLLPEEGTS